MSLNWREIDLVLDELPLTGSHIQQVIQPDFANIYFQIYHPRDPFWLRVCLQTGSTRIHRTSDGPRKPRTRQRFAQLLNSRIKGGKITDVEHVNSDRIIRIGVLRADENTLVWIRLWGGAANVIVTDAGGTIVDAFYRRPKRGEVTGGRFAPTTPEPRTRRAGAFTSRFSAEDEQSSQSVNEQVDAFYGRIEAADTRSRLLSAARNTLSVRCAKLGERAERARALGAEPDSSDRNQLFGDLITANLHRISGGDPWLEAEDYTNGDSPIRIALRTDLSPQANAAHYYDRAKKTRRRRAAAAIELRNLESRMEETKRTIATLDDLATGELRALVAETAPRGTTGQDTGRASPGLHFTSGGFAILIGRNARENDALLRYHVRGNDVWMHTRDYPGGYVFIRTLKGKSVPLDTLLDAGNLAVYFSRARTNGRADLYYTHVKYLRRAKGGPIGLVLPTHEKNLTITLDPDRLSRLLGRD